MATRRKKRRATSRRRRRRPVSANPKRRRRRKHAPFSRAARRRVGLNPRRRRRHRVNRHRSRVRHRRNPGSPSAGGIVRTITTGLVNGLTVEAGRGLTGVIANKIPFGQTSQASKAAINILTGVGLSMAIRKLTKSDRYAAFFLAGAIGKAIEPYLMQVPVLGAGLAGVGEWPRALGEWPRARALGAFPQAAVTDGSYLETDGITS